MGLLDFIFKRSRTINPSNGVQTGYFSKEEVRIIETSDLTGYTANPTGVFCCTNRNCLSHRLRYIPAQNEAIADTMRCPQCGHWMIHEELHLTRSRLSQKIKYDGAGSREIYQDALEMLSLDERIFMAWSLVDPNDTNHKDLQVTSFDILLDLAPIIFDEVTLGNLSRCMEKLTLNKYPADRIASAYARLHKFRSFYQQLKQSQTYKQVELKKDFLTFCSDVGDPTWIFYVWSNFGFFKRVNIKNRVYLTKQI